MFSYGNIVQSERYVIGKSSGVFINEDSIVKIYGIRNKARVKPVRNSYEDCFLRELECLKRLKGKPHFPQLIKAEHDILAMEMSNTGDSLFDTWHEHNLKLYVDQAHSIVDTIKDTGIHYNYPGMDPMDNRNNNQGFPLSNFCIEDGELSLIDFELAWCEGAPSNPRLEFLYKHFDIDAFRKSVLYALNNPYESWASELKAKLPDVTKFEQLKNYNPRKVFRDMTTFTQPSDKIVKEWNKYQKRFGLADSQDRVERMKLSSICKPEHKLVDIGCNDGYITKLVAPMVESATGVEPFVELPDDKPANVSWVRSTFNDFVDQNTIQYNVLLSLAVSIQLRDFGGLTEQQIVDAYYSLLAPGGIVCHETQKLENRPNNQAHTNAMITAFKNKFVQLDHGQARPSGHREYYHFQKVA